MNPIQALIQQLSEPKLHYVPGSEAPIRKPPTSLELRAAKALYQAYKTKLPPVEELTEEPNQEQLKNEPPQS